MNNFGLRFLALAAVVVWITMLVACPTPETTLFSHGFGSYALRSPWTPAGGWIEGTGYESESWEIVADGVQGHVARQTDAQNSVMANDSFTGTDFMFSMKVKTVSTSGQIGILGRYRGSQNFYYLTLGNPDGPALVLGKFVGGVHEGCGSRAFTYAADTRYELTMGFDGNTITGSVDVVELISYTDDGEKEGPLISDGGIGFGSFNVDYGCYDDALVEEDP